MTRWEQPTDDPYSRLDHMDGLGETLAAMTPEQRREAVDADTTIQPAPEQSPASRRTSFWIAIGMLLIVLGEIVYLIVAHP